MSERARVLVLLVAAVSAPTAAQTTRPTAVPSAPITASYHVRRATSPIHVDGSLSETAWKETDSITDFRQREPLEGAAATERTVVRIVRDADRLYVAVRAYDRDMTSLRSTQLRRDADLSPDDNVTVLIDSRRDRRSAFLFRTNPGGAMWDAQLTGLETVNENWNGVWQVATAVDSVSWTAEFAIPLRVLRFKAGNDVIGVNMRRFVRRKNEEDLWQSWSRSQGIYNLLNTADAGGFADASHDRPVELRPYVLGRAVAPSFDPSGGRAGNGAMDGKAGLDAKLGVGSAMTADVTVNTDFAQVEADQQVINLTRFPVFFPEKREFFLESSGLFDVGTSGRVQLFYSRRVGLDSNGAPVPILGGARLYGKQGPWAIGLLDVRTGGSENANDVAVRVARDVFARSTVAAMMVDRTLLGRGQSERGGGIDLDLPLVFGGHNVEPHAWLMGTRTPEAPGTPLAWRLSTDYPNDLFDNFVSLYRIDDGFAPTVGFVRRTGIWETTGHIDYMPRPRLLGIRKLDLTPIPSWDIIADRSRGDLRRTATWETADFEWHVLAGELHSGDEFEVNIVRDLDAPATSFEIFRDVTVAPGRYWWTSGNVQYESSPGRPVSFSSVLSAGRFYDGHSRTVEVGATVRGGGHVILGASFGATEARLSSGSFTATQLTGRVEYAFSPRADFLGFAQYENEERRADFNLRFHWIPTIGDDFYVVWNSGFTTDPAAPWRFPRARALAHPLTGALVLKAVHLLAR